MSISTKKFSLFATSLVLLGLASSAQDTTSKKVRITSSFKPVLKEAAKINFNASPAVSDTSKPRLQYNIPNQNLNLAFTPGGLRPLALAVDTGGRWKNESSLKAGVGNYATPFVQLGLSAGDGKNSGVNFYAQHASSKGNIQYQDYSNTNAELNGFFKTGNTEWNARVGGALDKYKKYGFEPKTLAFPSDSINVTFHTYRARLALRNINRTDLGISYAPEISIDAFSDGLSNSESNSYINLPLQKTLGNSFEVDVAATANISTYSPRNKSSQTNNWFAISPSILYKTANINIQAGLRPAWDKKEPHLFPNLLAEVVSSDGRFSFQAGWTGYLRNAGYEYQASINPWIWAPQTVYNSSIEERYAGIKGSVGDHFSYSAKLAFNTIKNQPLFTNDTVNGGKSFMVINEPRMNVLNIGGELGYTVGETFSIISNFQVNQYSPKYATKAWGLLPDEWKTTLRLQVMKDLYVNSELYAFDGTWYQKKGGGYGSLGSAFDLSAGLEFKVYKNIKIWGQFNNMLNQQYQRWNQYPVYGFNFLAGVVLSFGQLK